MEDTMKVILEACDIARQASTIMKNRPSRAQIEQKGNASNYVTMADKAVQDYLEEHLPNLLVGSVFLGEESSSWQHDADYVWVVDPIDGTSNFIRDLGASVISVALFQKKDLIGGLIYYPYRDEMYYAAKGRGAYLNGERIHVSDRDFEHSHLCSAMSLYEKKYAPACFRIIDKVYSQADDLRRFGAAALELAFLSAGRVELYFEMRLFPWDMAAGAILIEEAGGYWECLYEEGMPIDKLTPFIAANTKENFEKLRSIVCEQIPAVPYEQSVAKLLSE
ncbi:MAG: inositol monophosphatase [Lachnospiraceae bacterium]|nr:inositol monophosphatase [Lachnospiraceae bacterium]